VNWLGDAVMTTPAMARLREAFPKAHLALLTHEKLAELWKHHPAVDQVVSFRPGETPWAIGRRLRALDFDTALLLPDSPRAALEIWLAGIPERVGAARPWRNGFLTRALPPAPEATRMRKRTPREARERLALNSPPEAYAARSHQLYHYAHLVSALGASPALLAPSLHLTPHERGELGDRLLDRAGVKNAGPGSTWLGLNAGAEYGPAKRWPLDRFAQAANEVSQRTGCRWLIFGGPGDQPLAEALLAQIPSAASLCGRTTLRELMIGLARCRLLLTNDTGPMHLAAALGVTVVALFGSTSPDLTGPGLPGSTAHALLRQPPPCAPCFLRECPLDFRCMRNLTVQEVVRTVLQRLGAPA